MPTYLLRRTGKSELRRLGRTAKRSMLIGTLLIGIGASFIFIFSNNPYVLSFSMPLRHAFGTLSGAVGLIVFGIGCLGFIGALDDNRNLRTGFQIQPGVYYGFSSWGFVSGWILVPAIFLGIAGIFFSLGAFVSRIVRLF